MKKWKFLCTPAINYHYAVYETIEAEDRESAIAYFETTYPDRKWWGTVEIITKNK